MGGLQYNISDPGMFHQKIMEFSTLSNAATRILRALLVKSNDFQLTIIKYSFIEIYFINNVTVLIRSLFLSRGVVIICILDQSNTPTLFRI